MDTLRADHLGIYGYGRPTSSDLERIFAGGAVFDRAYATASYTSASTASILSGRLPQEHGVRLFDQLLPERAVLVTDLLPEAYERVAFVSSRVVSDDGMGLARRFDHFDDRMDLRDDVPRVERTARQTTDDVLRWLRDARDPDRPLFLWVHYMDPHAPYRPPDPWIHRFSHREPHPGKSARIPEYAREEGVEDPLYYVDRYDEEVAYTAAQVARLLRGYARLRPLDDALVIFTADHGETLAERRFAFTHANHVWDEQVRVPLLVRGPGVEAGHRTSLVSLIDIVPTVLAFAGAPVPEDLEGTDLRARSPEADRTVFFEAVHAFGQHQWRGALRGGEKWTLRLRSQAPHVEAARAYDLSTDPGERRPRRFDPETEGDPAARRLWELVQSDPDPAGRPREFRRGTLTEETAHLLRELGYADAWLGPPDAEGDPDGSDAEAGRGDSDPEADPGGSEARPRGE